MIELIVMRLADMHRVHPMQDDSRRCSHCNERVGIYPSGQHMLRADPTLRIVCQICHERLGPADVSVLAPGAEMEPFESQDR
jgi:hypothetical protein